MTTITKVEVKDQTLNLNFPISFQSNTITFQISPPVQGLKGLPTRFVERLVIWPWIATIEWIMNYQGKHPPTKLSAMATSFNASITQDQPWLIDSVATDRVTSSLNRLSFPKPYNGQEHLTIGNGQNLPITHIGTL